MYRAHVLVCGGTGCTSSGSQKIIERLKRELDKKLFDGKRPKLKSKEDYLLFLVIEEQEYYRKYLLFAL